MSSGDRIELAVAKNLAGDLIEHLADTMAWYMVAGSIRREKPMVGDVEIVVLPNWKTGFLNRLDVLVDMDVIRKAVYGASYRWGESYRGLIYRGHKVEIFVCDEHNCGYILWLRTGSGLKNTYVMTRLKQCNAAVRFADGYGWHVTYEQNHPDYDAERGYAKLARLHIPDELVMYKLLGMPIVKPRLRERRAYEPHLKTWVYCPSAEELEALYVPELRQGRLF